VFRYIDAANVDLKAFTERFYHKLTFSHLDPVLDTLKWLKEETDIWFEITNLIIPDENDNPDETKKLCDWVVENLGDRVPLHFTAFHPDFKLTDKPATPAATLSKRGKLPNRPESNIATSATFGMTKGKRPYCPNCHRALIRRSWHDILENNLDGDRCPCGELIPGHFSLDRPRFNNTAQSTTIGHALT